MFVRKSRGLTFTSVSLAIICGFVSSVYGFQPILKAFHSGEQKSFTRDNLDKTPTAEKQENLEKN